MTEATIQEWDPNQAPSAHERIKLTESAIQHVRARMQDGKTRGLRLRIEQKGCNGWMCHAEDLDTWSADFDWVFEMGDVIVAVEKSHFYAIKGMEIDFIKQGLNHVFSFNNPNAVVSCGCGESFSIETKEESV